MKMRLEGGYSGKEVDEKSQRRAERFSSDIEDIQRALEDLSSSEASGDVE